jgi:tetratricopeptide (TPR) repeat protein
MKHTQFFLLFTLCCGTFLACRNEKTGATDDFKPTGNPSIDKITALLQSNPKSDSLWALRGVAFYKEERFDESIRDFKKAINLDSTRLDYYHALADAYLDFAQSKDAVNMLNLALKRAPSRIPTLLKLSEFQLILKHYPESEAACERIIALDANNAEANFMKGRIYKETGDTLRAMGFFQRAVEQNADHFDAYMQLGLLSAQKHNPRALDYYKNALRIDSTSTEALYAKAMYYQELPKPDIATALALYHKIILLDPQNTDALFNTGVLQLAQNKVAEAEKNFELSSKTDVTCARCFYMRGEVAAMKHDNAAAKQFYQQALNLDPNLEACQKALDKLK